MCVHVVSHVQLFATLWTSRLLCSWGFSRQEYWSGLPCSPPRDLPNPGIEPRSPALQVDSLLPEPRGKRMNTRLGRLSLLQGIFPTQQSNRGLLHCRWILYQLSYQGSPYMYEDKETVFPSFCQPVASMWLWQAVLVLQIQAMLCKLVTI